ncbi:MAG TPA: TonB-dependent receptor [Vicinamibacterales bacterium]|nr:TonB-dependent receptor [Vicinamibacterales bacterium]
MRRFAHLLAVLLFGAGMLSTVGLAQTQTGTVEGTVADPQGGVLPGVTITLTGPQGSQTTVTDAEGRFRFVGVQPATYTVKTDIPGFLPQESEVTVGMARTSTVDFTLRLANVAETVEVRATSSAVDVKSTATETSISNDLLTDIPIYSSTSTGLLNYAPGINSSSAYGAQGSYGNALLMDGVDTRDPEGGSAWTFFNQNLIQEIQIGGLGAAAEYGGFTGAIINTITKSGTNAYSGLFSIRYTNDSLASDNLDDEILTANPTLGQAAVLNKLADYTVQMGGPIKRDKAFFFGSVQRYYADSNPSGPVTTSTDVSPRLNAKFTIQASPTDTLILGVQYDQYNLDGRVGYWPASQATDRQTVEEDAPEWVWNAQYRKIFGSTGLFEAKFTGYDGYYYLDPVDPSPFSFDGATGEYSGGGGGLYYADRGRNQLQVSFTKYAERFGSHSFKFGAEIERSDVRSQYQPYGPAGFYDYFYGGVPYYRVRYGYDFQGKNKRTSMYAQDQWSVGRFTMNLGLRLDHMRGHSPVLDEDVYTPAAAWGPRLGVAYDVTGRNTSVLKAFWGRYYEGTATGFFTAATPGLQDYTYQYYDADGNLTDDVEVIIPGIVYGIHDDIKHPRTDEFSLAYEIQLTNTLRLTASGIWRETGNFINNVIEGAAFEPVQLTNEYTNQTFTGYRWANADESSENFTIRNTEGHQYIDTNGNVIATADPNRDYKGLMLVLNSSFRNRLGYQVSYVLSKAEGNVDNSGFGVWLGGTTWNSPNTAIINAQGELTNSRRHEFKAYVSYQVPRVDVMIGANYTGLSGRPYQPFGQYSNSQLNLPFSSRRQIYLTPRGSLRNDAFHQLDLRLEKAFRIQTNRFGVYADITNLFNANTVTTRQTRYPNTTISGETVLFDAPTVVQGARQITFGGRWMF